MIIEVADTGALDAVFSVSQRLAVAGQGRRAGHGLAAVRPERQKVEGAVRQIAPSADATTGTYTIKVGLTDPPAAMRLGALVRGRVRDQPGRTSSACRRRRWCRPATSRRCGSSAPTQAVHLTPVTVERYDTDAVLISDGLKKGDLVVIAGVNSLAEGQVVNVDKVDAAMRSHNLSAWAIAHRIAHPLLHDPLPGGRRVVLRQSRPRGGSVPSRSTPWWSPPAGRARRSSTP